MTVAVEKLQLKDVLERPGHGRQDGGRTLRVLRTPPSSAQIHCHIRSCFRANRDSRGASAPPDSGSSNPGLGSACNRWEAAPAREPGRAQGRDCPAAEAIRRAPHRSRPTGTDRGNRGRAWRHRAIQCAWREVRRVAARGVESACNRGEAAPAREPGRAQGRDRPAAEAIRRALRRSRPAGTDRGHQGRAWRHRAIRCTRREVSGRLHAESATLEASGFGPDGLWGRSEPRGSVDPAPGA
ncbi:hypothetical protein NDU88_001106 [Pleurodeles waltl]|uniref:Uncharacterized protein n=1 Tax=Pleurodeles waltl TaxID=8319 RepID=A0AAV7VWK4_PLEWA|nr:hypothetical protein NDU88_001106 [Pleurodeles waltl]